MYYGVLLCSAGIFSALASIPLPWVSYADVDLGVLVLSLRQIGIVALVLQYAAFAFAFIIDRFAIRMMTVQESISPLRNFIHWLLAPPTLFIYSVIAFYAICRFVFAGKVMARHDMAAKEGLGANTSAGSSAPLPASSTSAVGVANADEDDSGMVGFHRSNSTERRCSNQRSASATLTDKHLSPESLQRVSNDGISMHATKDLPGESSGLLCTLPDKFYFGQFSVNVAGPAV